MKIRAFFISVLLIPAAALTAYYAAARQETSSGFSIPKDKSPSEVIQTLVQKCTMNWKKMWISFRI